MDKQTAKIEISQYKNGALNSIEDFAAVEEPLEISIAFTEENTIKFKIISVTMRTPGNDVELAIGFLFTENIITTNTHIDKIEVKGENKICVFIAGTFKLQIQQTERNFYTTSSCGVCGKASLEAISTLVNHVCYPQAIAISKQIFLDLKSELGSHQTAFNKTGGVHAATLFTLDGKYINSYEDVGRHNALDKLIGEQLQLKSIPTMNRILLLSGRASFELIQKAAMANIPVVCAIGAPSSLAIALAKEMDITLIGFLKAESFNIYSGSERILA
jgi:FdhD protein